MSGSQAIVLALALTAPAQQLDLARHLTPYHAVTEYQRLLYRYPNSPEASTAQEELGSLYQRLGLEAQARQWWERALERHFKPQLQARIAESYLRDGDSLNARLIYEELGGEAGDIGTVRCLLHEYRWSEAQLATAALAEQQPKWQPLVDELDVVKSAPYLDPAEMGRLSLWIPGWGQWQSGQKENALGSLLINGLFISLAGYRFAQRDPWGGLAFLLFGSRFYFGGSENARDFAANANEAQDQQALKDCLKLFSKASSPAEPGTQTAP